MMPDLRRFRVSFLFNGSHRGRGPPRPGACSSPRRASRPHDPSGWAKSDQPGTTNAHRQAGSRDCDGPVIFESSARWLHPSDSPLQLRSKNAVRKRGKLKGGPARSYVGWGPRGTTLKRPGETQKLYEQLFSKSHRPSPPGGPSARVMRVVRSVWGFGRLRLRVASPCWPGQGKMTGLRLGICLKPWQVIAWFPIAFRQAWFELQRAQTHPKWRRPRRVYSAVPSQSRLEGHGPQDGMA